MKGKRVYNGFYKIDLLKTPQGPREVVRATDSVAILPPTALYGASIPAQNDNDNL